MPGEAHGQKAGDGFVRVDIQDELEGLGELLGDGSDQAGDEQCSHVVGTPPGHRATRFMNGLEVEPAGDSSLEIDHHVLGHGVAVGESEAMELGEGDDRPFDRPLPDRLLRAPDPPATSPASLQRGKAGPASRRRRSESKHRTGSDRSALPLLPIALGQDPHPGIEEPDQRITQPDQERRVEQAVFRT